MLGVRIPPEAPRELKLKVKIDCNALEMTNGFLDHLSFMIDCDITVFENNESIKVPFDSERLKPRILESNLSNITKENLLKDDTLERLVTDVIFKTINKIDINYSEVKTI